MADKLLNRLPLVIRDFQEIEAALAAQEQALDTLWDACADVAHDQFVTEATAQGVRRWEGMLGLAPSGTMDDRKQAILTQLNYKLPYTYRRLVENLTAMCGDDYTLELQENTYYLRMTLNSAKGMQLASVKALLERMLPVNIHYEIQIQQGVPTVVVAVKSSVYSVDYRKTGSYPKTATLGRIHSWEAVSSASGRRHLISYPVCGTVTKEATIGRVVSAETAAALAETGYLFAAPICGVHTGQGTRGKLNRIPVASEVQAAAYLATPARCGTMRCRKGA